MIVRYLLAALGAGLLAGLLILPVQYARLVPLILHAEEFEEGAAHGHAARAGFFVSPAQAHEAAAPAGAQEEGGSMFESRLLGTFLADLVTGAGFALILLAASLLLGVPLTLANGALWGLAGFGIVTLAPALGLAPELPAMPAADLAARQAWWAATVALSALGLWLVVLRRPAVAKAAGVFALLLPHLLGAPQPADLASPVPPGLAAEFAVASLGTSAAFWMMLALLAGFLFDRLGRTAPAPL